VFYDNYFTGVDLQVYPAKNGIHSVGTVRSNRLPSCTLMTEAQLKKEGRGAIDEKTVVIDGVHLSAVRWHDNKAVTLLSTFAGSEPISEVSRWNNKSKCRETVQCPNVIKVYNSHMGGVDLIDSLIGLYRTRIRSKKWYLRLFFHLLDMPGCCTESKRMAQSQNLRRFMSSRLALLSHFVPVLRKRQSEVGHQVYQLIKTENFQIIQKKLDGNSRKKRPTQVRPLPELRDDGIHHYPK